MTKETVNKFREAKLTKRIFVHRLFTTIASRYDWFNRLASLGLDQDWRRQAIAESGLRRGMDVLDVCTGTGDLALLCATIPPPLGQPTAGSIPSRTDRRGMERPACRRDPRGGGTVVGLDFTQPMLRAAVRKGQASGLDVDWLRGDAQALPFAAGTFDRVFIGFSTRNLSDLEGGVCEMVRVLKPGGELVVLETGRPANALVRIGYLVFLATVARLIGLVLTGRLWPFTYLAKSVKGFLTPAEVVALLNACGTQARYVPLSGGLASLYLASKPPAMANDQ